MSCVGGVYAFELCDIRCGMSCGLMSCVKCAVIVVE
jgi:hypothetical protein